MWHCINSDKLPRDPISTQNGEKKKVDIEGNRRERIFRKRLKKATEEWTKKRSQDHIGHRERSNTNSVIKKMISNDIKDKMRRGQAYVKIIYKP